MIKTCPLLILHWKLWVTTSKQGSNCVEIGSRTQSTMNFLRLTFCTPCSFMTLISAYHINICESTSSNCMSQIAMVNSTIKKIVNMATHGCLVLYTFAMVENQPSSFQIPFQLHMPHNVNTTNKTMSGHLGQEAFRTTLPKENIILDVIIMTSPFEL
jgi:hypothetical protein